jgi:hypothetical protein
MAKEPSAKKKKSAKKDKRRAGAKRQERRFVSQAGTNVMLVRGMGAVAAILLGAGAWAYVYAQSFTEDSQKPIPSYLIAAGAVLMGIAIWIGTSSENPVRVGDPGIAVEKGDIRRMPWWGVEKIRFEAGSLALVISGTDESNVAWTFKVSVKAHPEAVGWIVREAQERIPRKVDIPEETLEKLPNAGEHAGQRIDLEPLQVVGKRCAATGKTISYEPDARVCARCERVYAKKAVPKKCKCGNSLAHLVPAENDDSYDDDDDDKRTSSQRMKATEEEAAEG